MAILTTVSTTANSITVRVDQLDTSYPRNDRDALMYYRITGDYLYHGILQPIPAYISSTSTYMFTNLQQNTLYDLGAQVRYTDGQGYWRSIDLFNSARTGTSAVKPALFYWSNTIAPGQSVKNLTASDWNRFTAKINEVHNYYRIIRNHQISQYGFSQVNSGTPIYATYYNQAVNAIKAMTLIGAGGYLNTQATGSPITAQKITVLASELNSAIGAI